MNLDEAQQILIACRAGTIDQDDPPVREALALAERDPRLAEWWRNQQLVHAALRERFRSLPVPDDLRADILAKTRVVPVVWWRSTPARVLAIAAVLIALLSLVLVRRPPEEPDTFADFRERMIRTVVREYRMDLTTSGESTIREFLRDNQGHPDFRLPAPLRAVPLFGVGRLSWHGRSVSMICFERRPATLMYLFVIDQSAFADPPGTTPAFAEVVQRATASWADGSQVYVLASEAGAADLRSLIP